MVRDNCFMAKIQVKYICTECGAQYPRWTGRCDACGNWNTISEEVFESSGPRKSSSAKPVKVTNLSEVSDVKIERIASQIAEFDQVLGGGIVPGSLILVGGDPGIGKSTLILQVASKIENTLYISGEESERQIQMRAQRLGVKNGLKLLSETNIETIAATVLEQKPELVIIDSIQTMYSADIPGTPGSVSQLSLCASKLMNLAKENHIAIILIGHVTKEGNIAGPRVLEHLVDVVLYLEGDRFGSFRILRGVKNRFGSTNEAGIFEMLESGMEAVKNPSEIMIAERAHKSPGSVIFPAMEGSRPLLVEIQALSSATTFGYPKRTASGFDLNRLNLLAAVLQKRCGLNLSTQDIYLNIAGGISVREPAADLAVGVAIASVFRNKEVPEDVIILGEIGLAGEVRSVNNIEKRLAEAEKLGFKKAVIPKFRGSAPLLRSATGGQAKGLNIIMVTSVKEAIEKVL
jgi:DNA repair protein RadA/Sms